MDRVREGNLQGPPSSTLRGSLQQPTDYDPTRATSVNGVSSLGTALLPKSPTSPKRRATFSDQAVEIHEEPLREPEADNEWVKQSFMFFVMGMSGWWSVNAMMWAESPIYINPRIGSPEGNSITNWLSVACQIGNVFPFLYKGAFNKQQQAKILTGSVFVCQFVAMLSCVACALLWHDTVEINGSQHSVWLILCVLVAGGVGCMSNVTFWALCVRYPGTHCTKAMSVGTTVGGLISTVLATPIGQNSGAAHPRFSVRTFMFIIAAVQALFLVCFMSMPKPPPDGPEGGLKHSDLAARTASKASIMRSGSRARLLSSGDSPTAAAAGEVGLLGRPLHYRAGMSPALKGLVLFIMFLVYGLTYALPSLGPYIVDCYPRKTQLLMWMNVMQQAGDVLGRAATAVPWVPAVPTLLCMTATVVLISGILILGSLASAQVPQVLPGDPSPLHWVIPVVFFMYYFLRGYVVTLLYIRVKLDVRKSEAEHFSGNMGVAGQGGALLSNLVLFVLINVLGYMSGGAAAAADGSDSGVGSMGGGGGMGGLPAFCSTHT